MSRLVQIHPDLVVDADNVLSIEHQRERQTGFGLTVSAGFTVRVRENGEVVDYFVSEVENITVASMLARVRASTGG